MKFEIYKDKIGEWRWRFKAKNGEIVASGEGYVNKGDCLHGIDLVKATHSETPIIDL